MKAQRRARAGRQSWRTLGRMFVLVVFLGGLLIGAGAASATVAADTLQNVRFGDHGSYERAVLDLGYGQTLGDVAPEYTWRYRDGDWILRVNLPSVASTLKTGGDGLGLGISRYYVVRRTDGSLAVDLRLARPAQVNVFGLAHPSRVVVDVTPYGLPFYPEPAANEKIVITQPRLSYLVGPGTFKVSGYGRPFEAQGVWRIKTSSGKVVREGTYITNDWTTAWGTFEFEATYPARLAGHTGVLQVGERSPRDGRFHGASVSLRFR